MAKKPAGKKVAEAAGAASSKKAAPGNSIEEAMSKAAAQAQAEGITDPDEIRQRMLEARKQVNAGNRAES
jgi:hypothetical protein